MMRMNRLCLLFAMIAAALAAASCYTEELANNDYNQAVPEVQYRDIVLDAHQNGQDTRTEMSNVTSSGASVLWSTGDAISIILNGLASRLESTATAASATTSFEGSLAVDIATFQTGDPVWGVYPYSDKVSISNNLVRTSLPSIQNGKTGSFANNLMILLGQTHLTQANLSQNPVELSMDFKNVCSGVRFQVSRSDIRTVVMTANGDEPLSGAMLLGMDGNTPTVAPVSGATSSHVELLAPGGTFSPGQWYYIVTLPGTLSQGVSFTLATETQVGTRSFNSSFTLMPGNFLQVPNLDANVSMTNFGPATPVIATPDTWVGEDELGRAFPDFDDVGATKSNRHVVIFYSPWHCGTHVDYPNIFNTSAVKRDFPEAFDNSNPNLASLWWNPNDATQNSDPNLWNKYFPLKWGFTYNQISFWGTPLFGYYRTTDPWVLRKHAEMLADAGVDAVVFDCSNQDLLFEVSVNQIILTWSQAKRDGVNVPKLVFLLYFAEDSGDGNYYPAKGLRKVYNTYYSNSAFDDMWFYVDGKPLIMAYPSSLALYPVDTTHDAEILAHFTFRPGQSDYVSGNAPGLNQWAWMQTFPSIQTNTFSNGEEITVSVAQNASDYSSGHAYAFNSAGTYGRSYTYVDKNTKLTSNSYIYGYNFQEQWNNALAKNIPYIFVTGWNEWIAMMQYEWPPRSLNYTYGGTYGPPSFADQFDWERSRDCEPTLDWGDHGDNYYNQLAQNVRRYKGVSAYPSVSGKATITMDGSFSDWANVSPDFKHYPGNIMYRDHDGHTNGTGSGGQLHYTNSTGRNDIVDAKVTRDAEYVYFFVETASNISSRTDARWMRLLINIDCDWSTGWKGYDFCLNYENPNSSTQGYISQCSGSSWHWTRAGTYEYRLNGNKMEIKVARSLLGVSESKLDFAFKWADNNLSDSPAGGETRILNLYVDGDAAPGGRFNFHYMEPYF